MIRQLKNFLWEWDEVTHELRLTFQPYGISESMSIVIDKNHLYSLNSFLTRVWRKMSSKKRVKTK